MPNRNGQGPKGSGSGSGRGLCNRTSQTVAQQHETPHDQRALESPRPVTDCKGPRGCGTGKERRGNGCNSRRGQR